MRPGAGLTSQMRRGIQEKGGVGKGGDWAGHLTLLMPGQSFAAKCILLEGREPLEQRLDYQKVDPAAYRAVLGLENHLHGPAGLEPQLIHLLKLRASQMNGCAYCVDMHTKEARKDGLSEQWIALVCVWREALVFQPRERALLAWTEALTRMGEAGAPDELYQAMRAHFSERDTVNLTVAIATINVWNRLAVGFRSAHPLDAGA